MIAEIPPAMEISYEKEQQILKDHYTLFYEILAKGEFSPQAGVEMKEGVRRAVSGIPFFCHNAILKYPSKNSSWDDCINQQIQFFRTTKTPFVWYVDEKVDLDFQKKLRERGFTEGGIFQGVIGVLAPTLLPPAIPDGWSIHLVKTEAEMDEFQHLISITFSFNKKIEELYRKAMWIGANSTSPKMFHWIARHEKKAVSALTTLIMGDQVSFWNGASLPEYRRQGFSSALRRFTLHDAISKGCKIGMSYLPSDGLALGICRQLGYEPRWRFRAFIAPENTDSGTETKSMQ
jgi:ribosomal protein S18 acetylase RimI-like enzyme